MKTLIKRIARNIYFCHQCRKRIEPLSEYFSARYGRARVTYCAACGDQLKARHLYK
ncbi:MAG: hypothetical protein M3209_09605 [Acidobacteriota bacterium]|nr:hypothetical protein [Acidobacteriota bacterium]